MGLALAWMLWQTAQGLYNLGRPGPLLPGLQPGPTADAHAAPERRRIYSNLLFLENLFEFSRLRR